jgi:hypothetical protein
MKNLDLNVYGVNKMRNAEMRNTNGGDGGVSIAIALIGAAIYVYNNWDDFVEGVKEGYRETKN